MSDEECFIRAFNVRRVPKRGDASYYESDLGRIVISGCQQVVVGERRALREAVACILKRKLA